MKDRYQLTAQDQEIKRNEALKQQALEKLAFVKKMTHTDAVYDMDAFDIREIFELIEQAGLELPR